MGTLTARIIITIIISSQEDPGVAWTNPGQDAVGWVELVMMDLADGAALNRHWRPQIWTAGFPGYLSAVDPAFGDQADYGQIIKDFKEGVPGPGRYGPPGLATTARHRISGFFDKQEICTSHAERNHLSIRHFVRRFTRLSRL